MAEKKIKANWKKRFEHLSEEFSAYITAHDIQDSMHKNELEGVRSFYQKTLAETQKENQLLHESELHQMNALVDLRSELQKSQDRVQELVHENALLRAMQQPAEPIKRKWYNIF